MSDILEGSARPTDKVGRVLYKLSAGLALFGSFVVAAMAAVVAFNVTWRATSLGSLPGIIDLVELLTNTAVFAFLPYCQIMRENVIVDFILTKAPTRTKTVCDAFGSLMFIVVGCLLTWRTTLGGFDMYRYNEVFTTLDFPRWISFPYAVFCMSLLVTVCVYTFARSVAETRANKFFDESLNRGGPEMHGEG
ncbi:MAG: TRAP transporter small permease [Rhodospirillaceae bacterium]|nr:TRAP transporter small permease [Rhodospirillaceae bacterium]